MSSARHRLLVGATMTAVLTVAACGTGGAAGTSGDVPITQRAIAAVALEQLPDGPSTTEATFTDDDPKGALGADIRYGGDAETKMQGDLLRVYISPQVAKDPCDDDYLAGCEEREVDGGTLVLSWQEEEPEEDPGYVAVSLQKDDQEISVSWSGDTITGDPREQDLRISVEAMEKIAQDGRLGLTTSQATIDEGAALKDWDGGEPDPTAFNRVPSTDESLINSFWSAHGGYGAYSARSSSPLKEDFGPGAVGGRFEAEKNPDQPAQTIDVLASPQGPAWLAADPCDTKRFAGHCVEHRGGRYFAWVPGPAADGGEVWMFGLRDDEVVAIRSSGYTVPEGEEKARIWSDWYFLDSYLDNETFGLETDQEMLDLDLG